MRRGITLLVILVVAMFSCTGVALAEGGLWLKAYEGGPDVPKGAPVTFTVKITEPAAASECKFREPKGELTTENGTSNPMQFSLPPAYIKAELCEGNNKGFAESWIVGFFGVGLFAKVPKGDTAPRIRVGSTCQYKVNEMGGVLLNNLLPSPTESVAMEGSGSFVKGSETCPSTQAFRGTAAVINPTTEAPYYMTESP